MSDGENIEKYRKKLGKPIQHKEKQGKPTNSYKHNMATNSS